MTQERDHTIVKYEESEVMWTQKHSKLSAEHKRMIELSTGLKDDNKDLMIQIDKYIKRVNQLENTLEREKQEHKDTDMKVHDLKREKEGL